MVPLPNFQVPGRGPEIPSPRCCGQRIILGGPLREDVELDNRPLQGQGSGLRGVEGVRERPPLRAEQVRLQHRQVLRKVLVHRLDTDQAGPHQSLDAIAPRRPQIRRRDREPDLRPRAHGHVGRKRASARTR